jgi:hypothetical protein
VPARPVGWLKPADGLKRHPADSIVATRKSKLGIGCPEMNMQTSKIGVFHTETIDFAGGTILRLWVGVMKTKGIFNIEDFKRATFEKKCDVVTAQSNYIVTRTLGNCKVYLYHSGDFFIEVFYSPIYKKVLMINAFDDVDSLLPYTEKISLRNLAPED